MYLNEGTGMEKPNWMGPWLLLGGQPGEKTGYRYRTAIRGHCIIEGATAPISEREANLNIRSNLTCTTYRYRDFMSFYLPLRRQPPNKLVNCIDRPRLLIAIHVRVHLIFN